MRAAQFADAAALCSFESKRLPTQEEWEVAAVDYDSAARSPTAKSFNASLHSIWLDADEISRSLIHGMVGNVSEWTSTIFNGMQVVRGGSFLRWEPERARAVIVVAATDARADIGVRCAATPLP